MRELSARAAGRRPSDIRVLFDAAAADPRAIRLEVGEPDFTTPAHIIEAAAAAARDGWTGYGPNGGLASLREALADKIGRVDGYRAGPENVVVAAGGMNALFTVYLALLADGDQVLLPTPGFPNMDEMVRLVGGEPVFYPLRAAGGFLPDPEHLESLATDRTRLLFVNTPSNPTGSVFPAEVMESLVRFCDRRDLWLLSDEVYDEMLLDEDASHVAAGVYDEEERVISVYSFSKIYAMTGWRVGYAAAPRPVADLLRKLQEPVISCPSTISQQAALAALAGPRGPIREMRDAYRRRRDLALEAAREGGLRAVRPAGGMYILIEAGPGGGSLDFCLRLLREYGVSVAPGPVFGPGGEGYVRISLAAAEEDVTEGIRRLAAAVAAEGAPAAEGATENGKGGI